jgi:hypothetical protein
VLKARKAKTAKSAHLFKGKGGKEIRPSPPAPLPARERRDALPLPGGGLGRG